MAYILKTKVPIKITRDDTGRAVISNIDDKAETEITRTPVEIRNSNDVVRFSQTIGQDNQAELEIALSMIPSGSEEFNTFIERQKLVE